MSELLHRLVDDIPLPRMVRVRQRFEAERLEDPIGVLRGELGKDGVRARVQAGRKIAIAVGSRGINRIDELTRCVVDELKALGAQPFIVPSMGSHGGATDEGQAEVLAHLGISEATMGCPVRSSMDVIEIGKLDNGLPVYVDRISAEEADGIVVINRIKPHTAFRGPNESGLLKMIAIGLGNQKGAEATHLLGFKHMKENVVLMARMMMEKLPILFGVGVVENAYDKISHVEAVIPEEMEERDRELLVMAKARMPRLFFDEIDVLVIDFIGKNISGDGADPNVTGRYPTPYAHGGPDVNKMVVLRLTKESQGNANGVGTADFTTQRLVDDTDWPSTYANGLTSTVCAPTKQATTLPNDRMALQAAVKTCNVLDFKDCRMVRIRDTLHLEEIWISENLVPVAEAHPNVEVIGQPEEFQFDETGHLNVE